MINHQDEPGGDRESDWADDETLERRIREAGDLEGDASPPVQELIRVGREMFYSSAPTQAPANDNAGRPGKSLIGRRIGDFDFLEELGKGGMGVVYKARQCSLERIVAVKVIRSGDLATSAEIERFRREAESAGRLDHRCIVPVVDFKEEDGLHLLVMGFVEGRTLEDAMAGGPLPNRQAAEILRALAEAVSHAHDKQIVHRDLKPANVMIANDGEPRILDFGLARQLDRPDETVNAVMGTAPYMAPEQVEGRPVGPRCDVYGLGAILYHVLTGRPPFRESSLIRTLQLVRERDPEKPHRLNPNVDGDLQRICLRCLAKDPKDRYRSARALADDLKRYLEGQPLAENTGLSKLLQVFKPTGYNQEGFKTSYAALLCGGTWSMTHLVVFVALLISPGNWWLASTILAVGWTACFVQTLFVYIPVYWQLEHVERGSAMNWWGQFVALAAMYGIVFLALPQTTTVLGSVVYPLAAVFAMLSATAHAPHEGRSLWFAFLWLVVCWVMVAVPWLSPLLCGMLNTIVFLVSWQILQAPKGGPGHLQSATE